MRHRLLFAALLASTALVEPAQAGPAIGAVVAIAASAAGAWAAAAVAASGAILSAAVGTLVATGVSYAAQTVLAGGKKQRARPNSDASRMGNFAQPVSYREWVYGTVRKGGPIGFTGFANASRYYTVILASHPIQGVVQHYLDERQVAVDGSGLVTTAPIAGHGRIHFYAGDPGQPADADLIGAFPTQWTSAHDMAGLAYASIQAQRPRSDDAFSEIYPNGRQWDYLPVIRGHKGVYDPGPGTTGWTENAALVIANAITSIMGLQVDWPSVQVEAAYAGAGGKWSINGGLSSDQTHEDMRSALMAATDGYWFERPDGAVGFYLGRWIEPLVTLTDADFLVCELVDGARDGVTPTEVVTRYIEPGNGWREAVSGPIAFETGPFPRREEIVAMLCASHTQASRIAKRAGRQMRARYRLTGTVGLVGYELMAGRSGNPERFVRVQHVGLDQYFEILKLTRETAATFSFEAVSVDPSDFDFDPVTEEPDPPIRGAVSSSDTVPALSGVTATAIGAGRIEVRWTPPAGYLGQQAQIRRAGTTEWQLIDVPAGQAFVQIGGLTGATAAVDYEVQVRNRTRGYKTGAWAPASPVLVTALDNATPPAALAAFAATPAGSNVAVTWTAPNDVNYSAVRIYRASYPFAHTGPFSFSAATLVRTQAGAASAAGQWIDNTAASPGKHAYWAEPINASGVTNTAVRSGPAIATI